MFCRLIWLCLLNCITETIQATEGRSYFPHGPHIGQRCLTSMPQPLSRSFRCDIPVVFYRLNTIYTYIYKISSQNTTKFYCTVLYNMLHNYTFRPFFRPSSGCICLALKVMYPDEKLYYIDDEISIILTLALLWRVCRQFSMNGHRLRVWDGNDGIMFVSCSSVSIVVSGFSYAAQSLLCLLGRNM